MKTPTSHSMVKNEMDRLLEAIDAAPVAEKHPIFKKVDDKEYYETQLMFVFRKMEAAEHHLVNVKARLADNKAWAMAAMKKSKKPAKNLVAMESQVVTDVGAQAYVHELSAFLAAVRSGLDFLATAAVRTLSGKSAHSVHEMEKWVAKGQQGGVLDVVKSHQEWLSQLRAYRDELIHHSLPQAPARGWLKSIRGKTSKAVMPVVVPRMTPKRGFDTRRSRMMDEEAPLGLDRWDRHATVTYGDGTETTIEHEVSFRPSPSYMPILDFMTLHLSKYRSFSVDMFVELREGGFGTAKSTSPD